MQPPLLHLARYHTSVVAALPVASQRFQTYLNNNARYNPEDDGGPKEDENKNDDDDEEEEDGYDDDDDNDNRQGNPDNNNNNSDHLHWDWHVLQQRLLQMRAEVWDEELRQPPNPQLTAPELIHHLLQALWNNARPVPYAGFRVLLRSATCTWRHSLYQAVGAPPTTPEDLVAVALGETMGRPNNQFAILVPDEDNDENYHGHNQNGVMMITPKYTIEFPSDVVDYGDGTCWVECRLRCQTERSLLVVMGWQLRQRETDGAWLVDHIDWQDFRDQFRPGIGREEWMRICG